MSEMSSKSTKNVVSDMSLEPQKTVVSNMSEMSLEPQTFITISFYKSTKSIKPVFTGKVLLKDAFISSFIEQACENEKVEEIPIYFNNITIKMSKFIINYMKFYSKMDDEAKTIPDSEKNNNKFSYFVSSCKNPLEEYNMFMKYIDNSDPLEKFDENVSITMKDLSYESFMNVLYLQELSNYMGIKGLLHKLSNIMARFMCFALDKTTTGFEQKMQEEIELMTNAKDSELPLSLKTKVGRDLARKTNRSFMKRYDAEIKRKESEKKEKERQKNLTDEEILADYVPAPNEDEILADYESSSSEEEFEEKSEEEFEEKSEEDSEESPMIT